MSKLLNKIRVQAVFYINGSISLPKMKEQFKELLCKLLKLSVLENHIYIMYGKEKVQQSRKNLKWQKYCISCATIKLGSSMWMVAMHCFNINKEGVPRSGGVDD